jgi:hypothetical protein
MLKIFYVRSTSKSTNQILQESLLLVDPTCYKGFFFNFSFQKFNIIFITRETQILKLNDSTTLITLTQIHFNAQLINTSVKKSLQQTKIDQEDNSINFDSKEFEEKYKI